MTILYRSPNIIVDRYEWHVRVEMHYGRIARQYFFRPLATVRYKWRPVTSWQGTPPKLWKIFQTHHRHVKAAMDSETNRLRMAARASMKMAA